MATKKKRPMVADAVPVAMQSFKLEHRETQADRRERAAVELMEAQTKAKLADADESAARAELARAEAIKVRQEATCMGWNPPSE